ncbi:hypothetical protein TL16_g09053 [Triparma laevis f. inornata]|uniref:sn-1-specific diacylglycerol lipase n=1 Tax=Triparma laevis f. inornata TaxID=1714386 RepID=A0A9W7AZP4_9STRA|nr:hypothetical protein TL16_g09053 [Triparma laevis f. inornata]
MTLRKIISLQTNIPKGDIVMVKRSERGRPSFYVAIDRKRCEIVLCIRGTMSISDIFTDLTIEDASDDTCIEHSGIKSAASKVFNITSPVIMSLKKEHPDYRLVLTGHSLGAGCANYLSKLFKEEEGFGAKTFCYGVPCLEVGEERGAGGGWSRWVTGDDNSNVVSVIINGGEKKLRE